MPAVSGHQGSPRIEMGSPGLGALPHDRPRDSWAARVSLPATSGDSDGKREPRHVVIDGLLGATTHSRVTGEGYGLGAVGGTELEQDRRHIVLHRLDADAHSG